MSMKPITFEVPEEALATLDAIAEALGENRESVLQEAIAFYLADYEEEKALIAEVDRQFEAGETLSHEEVMAEHHAWKAGVLAREAA